MYVFCGKTCSRLHRLVQEGNPTATGWGSIAAAFYSPVITPEYAALETCPYFERHRGTNGLSIPAPAPPAPDDDVPRRTHASLHSTSLDTPGTNDGQNKDSNYMESFIAQTGIRLDEKDDGIA